MRKTAALSLLLLAACGSREALEPPPGDPLPPKPAMAERVPSPEELLEIPPIAQPERMDEPLKRSEPREDDPFDLQPPD